jgi:hypothetical protein
LPAFAKVTPILAAAVIAAWYGLGIVQAHDLNRASAIVSRSGPLSMQDGRKAASALATAGTFNPDSRVDIERGKLALARGERAAGLRIIEAVTRREPDWADAWFALASSADSGALSDAALRQIARLVPPVGHR